MASAFHLGSVRRLTCLSAAIGTVLLALLPHGALAAPLGTWVGGGANGMWATSSNWTGTAPVAGGTSSLVFAGSTRLTSTNDLANLTVDSISFTNVSTNNFTLSGSAITLASGTITTSATNSASTFPSPDNIQFGMTLTGSNRVQLGGGHSLSLSGVLAGSGSMTFTNTSGTPATYVSGSNTYSGGTLITGGQVYTQARGSNDAGNQSAFGTGTVTVSGSGAILLRNGSTISNNMVLSGSGGNQGAIRGAFGGSSWTATVSGSVTLAGNTLLASASTVTNDTTSKLLLSNTVDVDGNTLTLGPTANATIQTTIEISGGITGSGAVAVNGGNTGLKGLTLLSGSSNYSGGTTLSAGILRVTNANAVGTGPLAVNASGLEINNVALNAGTLTGSSTGVITSTGSGSASLVTTSATNSTFAGTISDGSGIVGLTKAGSGTLTLTGSNSNTGPTTLNGGALLLGGSNVLAGGGNLTFGGGTLQYSASNTLDYSSRIKNSSGPISINTAGQTITYAGVIDASNTSGLTKSGSGTLFLNGVNLFTGTTTVAAGTLGGNGSVTGPLVVAGAAILSPGASAGTSAIFGVGGLSLAATNSLVQLAVTGTTAGTEYDQILASGGSPQITYNGILELTLSGSYATNTAFDLFKGFTSASGDFTTLTLFASGSPYAGLTFTQTGTSRVWNTAFTSGGQYLSFNGDTGQLMVVPEPTTFALMGAALACTGWKLSRRRRRGTNA